MSFFSRLFRRTDTSAVPARGAADGPAQVHTARLDTTLADDQRPPRDLSQMAYGPELLALAREDLGAGTQPAAQRRLAELIDAGAVSFAQLGAALPDRALLIAIATLTKETSYLQTIISSIEDPDVFAHLAVSAASARVRQIAAEQLQDPAQLRRLLKEVRGKDKNVYKIIKRKCDALAEVEREAAQERARIIALCEAIERQPHKAFDALFVPSLEHLSNEWKRVAEHAPEELRVRVERALEQCAQIVTDHLRVLAAQAAQESAIANSDTQRTEIIAELRKLLVQLFALEDTAALNAELLTRQLQRLAERWDHTKRYKAPSREMQDVFARLRTAVEETLPFVQQHGTLRSLADALRTSQQSEWPQSLERIVGAKTLFDETGAPPQILIELEELIRVRRASQSEQRAARDAALNELEELIRRARGAANAGRTAQATRLRRTIDERLQALANVPEKLTAQVARLDERLQELRDWKTYAVAPKRAELIAQMEALVGSSEHPRELAERIKQLQEAWRELSKGGLEHDEDDWQRFNTAAQNAYQPCREYFAARAAERAESLQKRKQIVSELVSFRNTHDWNAPDWRDLARRLRTAKQHWREAGVTDRAETKPVQTQFDAILSELQAKLDTEYAANAERKRMLIERAQRCATVEDVRAAVEQVRKLQVAWKEIGPVARADDQVLWEQFRQHCDAVFQKSQEHHQEYVATLESNAAQARTLIERVEQAARQDGRELLELLPKLREVREEFEAIGALPKGVARDLQHRFDHAVDNYERRVSQYRAREAQELWRGVLAAADRIQALHWAKQQGGSDASMLGSSIREWIDARAKWPGDARERLEAQLARGEFPDAADNEQALRTLCIRAEIATETPTPASDAQLRREYQLAHLAREFGQRGPADRDERLQSLMLELLEIGPVAPEAYAELSARFAAAVGLSRAASA